MNKDRRQGLTLTRCDCCGRRRFCAVEGVAMCEDCCPGAVEQAREEAQARYLAQQEEELLPGEHPGPTVPYSEVSHLFRF